MMVHELSLVRRLVSLQIDKFAMVLAGMLVLPFLMHLIPQHYGVPIGAIFIPIFYAPLVAVIFFRGHVVLLSCIIAPTLNRLLTGRPDVWMSQVLTFELIIFASACLLIHKRFRYFWGTGAFAYLCAKLLSVFIFKGGVALSCGEFFTVFFQATSIALPGVIILLFINTLMVKFVR